MGGFYLVRRCWRGARIDEAQDERQVFIVGNAMRFSFTGGCVYNLLRH